MTKPIPQIKKYMTTTPVSIEKDASLIEASNLMSKNQIRHLPVLANGKIAGIISSTDVALIKGLRDVDLQKIKVQDCYSQHPYSVAPDAKLDEVLGEMAEKKFGCVLVNDNDHLVGIFTWVDALKATQELLETRLRR